MEGKRKKIPHLASSRRNDPTCLKFHVGVGQVSGGCLKGVWIVSGGCPEGVWWLSMECPNGMRGV